MDRSIVISHYQAEKLIDAREKNRIACQISPDLGLSIVDVILTEQGVEYPDGGMLRWDDLEEILDDKNKCYLVLENTILGIKKYSEYTNRLFTLFPTRSAPTMLLSGIPMHRIKDVDPYIDTMEKMNAVGPIYGRVLDTATGLGYTAIQASKSANMVVTIEIDPTALAIARLNPWSRELFSNPRIHQIVGDSFDMVKGMANEYYTIIVHDPPAFNLGGDLYSFVFYEELFRILKHGGKLFHYIGDPKSRSGQNITKGVVHRLREAGFQRIAHKPRAFGILATK